MEKILALGNLIDLINRASLFLRANNYISTEIFIGLNVSAITSFLSIIAHFQNGDKFFKELFTEFNARYDKLNNFLNEVKNDQELTTSEKGQVIDYLNLCAEEYMWVRKGWIPEHIWNSWKNGIELHQRKKPVKKVFDDERALWKSSYFGFFDEISELNESGS